MLYQQRAIFVTGKSPSLPAPMKYYYANSANQPTGPVTSEELSKLLSSGTITRNTNVIAEGSQQWVPLSTIAGFAAEPAPVKTPAATIQPIAPATPAPAAAVSTPVPAAAPVPATAPKASPATAKPVNIPTIMADFVSGLLESSRKILTQKLAEKVLSAMRLGFGGHVEQKKA